MAFREFDGALDGEQPGKGYVEFEGELDPVFGNLKNPADIKRPEGITDATFSAGIPEDTTPRIDMPGSVLNGTPSDVGSGKSLIEERGAPVSKEFYDKSRAAYDMATPDQRAAVTKVTGTAGNVMRAIDNMYGEQDKATDGMPNAERLSTRAEDLPANFGLDESKFDFDTYNRYKDASPLVKVWRGA
jgi:hypothetical protein